MSRMRFSAWRQERGLTLLELLVVVVLMVGVFSAILVLLDSIYNTYGKITAKTQNQRTALLIENDLTSDLRQAVKGADGHFQIDLTNPNLVVITEPRNRTATYDIASNQVKYQSDNGDAWINLTTDGTCRVTAPEDGSSLYTVTVTVGSGADQAVVSTAIAPYDWGK